MMLFILVFTECFIALFVSIVVFGENETAKMWLAIGIGIYSVLNVIGHLCRSTMEKAKELQKTNPTITPMFLAGIQMLYVIFFLFNGWYVTSAFIFLQALALMNHYPKFIELKNY